MATVPQLYLALVWVPRKQCCVNMINTNLLCLEFSSFIDSQTKIDNGWWYIDDGDIFDYLVACQFHHLQIADVSCLDSSVGDHLSISKNPLAHYAQRVRISHSFAVSLKNMYITNPLYVIEFFLQPKFREDDDDYSLHLLSRIMEMNLRTFKIVSGGRLVSESQKPNAIDQCESTDRLNMIKSCKQKLSQPNLEMVDSYCLRPSRKNILQGWVLGINSNLLLMPVLIKEKIQNFMKNIEFKWGKEYWIIQFWAPKMVDDRRYLQVLDQPYVVGSLANVLASFRNKCTAHSYFVDDGAKEEELGPPGRVFKNGHPEISPDLFHYTTKEYPIRNYAMHCFTVGRGYLALPIFEDEHDHNCVGVLEFQGFNYSELKVLSHEDFETELQVLSLEDIEIELKEAELFSTHTASYSRYLADEQPVNIIYGREEALTEVRNAFQLICNIPQLCMANVWIPNGECVTSISSNTSCMELALSKRHLGIFGPADQVERIHVQSRKGMIGMVLASENKACFCPNLCEFSIADQPLSHFEMSERREVCFAICLQSSHTGDLVYVVELFLYKGPKTYEYLRSFLNFLGPIMKHELKSFKMASGKELGDDLVVEVIEFSDANVVDSSESEQAHMFPIKFKHVLYVQETETEESRAAAASDSKRGKRKTRECSPVAASDSKTGAKGKSKPRHDLTREDLEPLFHVEKLKDVRKMLNVSKATLWRARVKYGLKPWPGKLKKNPLPRDSQPSTSSSNIQALDTNTESTHHVINVEEEEAEKVIIKVKYGEDIFKFELCLTLGVSKLFERVATELNLKMGTFKLKYRDEDNDEISLTRSSDLQLCPKSQTATGRTCIQFFVQLITSAFF